MRSLLDINQDYSDVIINKKEKISMIKRRKEYLNLTRPYNEDEKKDFNKISMLLQLQNEIEMHRKIRIKLSNECIIII